jgi:tetraacyldisaccharide 4'-kinase
LPVIAVGNLSVGGTGKTPQIEYLILLSDQYKVALSRGYKRQSKGFILPANTNAEILGDEPFQFLKIQTNSGSVDADRKME